MQIQHIYSYGELQNLHKINIDNFIYLIFYKEKNVNEFGEK